MTSNSSAWTEARASDPWLLRLTMIGLSQDELAGLGRIAQALGEATGVDGIAFWEAPDTRHTEEAAPAIIASWSRAEFPPGQFEFSHDQAILHLLSGPELDMVFEPVSPDVGAWTLRLLLPLTYLDGARGAVAIYSASALREEAYIMLDELLAPIPQLFSNVRQRQTLSLSNRCSDVLHRADRASPEGPLAESDLRSYFEQICRLVLEAFQCAEVGLYLSAHDSGEVRRFASTSQSGDLPGSIDGQVDWPGRVVRDGLAAAMPASSLSESGRRCTALLVPVMSGDHGWGLLWCQGSVGPPHHFSRSDISVLSPIAAQIAQYWSGWLQRRLIQEEIESWRSLANGLTVLNRLLYAELDRSSPRDQVVYKKVARVLVESVEGCTGVIVYDASADAGGSSGRVREVWRSEAGPVLDASDSPMLHLESSANEAYSAGTTVLVRDDEVLVAGVALPRWSLSAPMAIGKRRAGILQVYGDGTELPLSGPQMTEILADQLALYRHLRSSVSDLRAAKSDLQENLRGQAEAMEDLEHQLAGPILGATMRTERVLRVARFDSKTEQQLRAVRSLCRRAGRIAMSAGVYAEFSKGRKPRPRIELLGLDELMSALVAAARDAQELANPRRHLSFQVDRSAVHRLGRRLLEVDRSFFDQSVGQLLDNAAKYSFEGQEVEIGAELGDDQYSICVTSVGQPVDASDLARCTQRNWRSPEASAATGEGSGLGLWIVDNLMGSMSGALELEVSGRTFRAWLRFPVRQHAI